MAEAIDIRELNIRIEQQSQFVTNLVMGMNKVIVGQKHLVDCLLIGLLSDGHILLEGVPGLAKTLAIKTLSQLISSDYSRIQFTPDLLPADVVGTQIYSQKDEAFHVKRGPVFANFVLADEINRTSPKTQSALLEVMEEGKVTVDGISHPVPKPFLVMATQNPKGSAGTQMLPESQLDRFMICMSMGYPDLKSEIEIAKGQSIGQSYESIEGVMTGVQLQAMKETVENIFIHDRIYEYMMALIHATRKNPYIELGVSPRGMVALTKMVRANAFLNERDYVIPADVEDVFYDVTKHRIVLNTKARVTGVSGEAVLEKIMEDTTKPTSFKGKE